MPESNRASNDPDCQGPEDEDPVTPACLRGPDGCRGLVHGRKSFASTGLMIYECDRHMEGSWQRELELRHRYPVQPPPDWDPLDAGERWGDD